MPAACNGNLGALAFLATRFRRMIWSMDIPSSVHQLKWWKHCNSKAIYLPSPCTGTGCLLNVQAAKRWSLPPTCATMPGKEDGSLTVDFNRFQETMEEKKRGGKSSGKRMAHHPGQHHHNHHITISIITSITTDKYHAASGDHGAKESYSRTTVHRWPGIDSCPTFRHHVRA